MRKSSTVLAALAMGLVMAMSWTGLARAMDEFTTKWICVSRLQKQGYSFEDAYRICVSAVHPLDHVMKPGRETAVRHPRAQTKAVEPGRPQHGTEAAPGAEQDQPPKNTESSTDDPVEGL